MSDSYIKTMYGRLVIQTDSLNYKPIYNLGLVLDDMSKYIGYEKHFEMFIDGHKVEISNVFELEENMYYGFSVDNKLYYVKRSDYDKLSFYGENYEIQI